jgi:hypothetical protein
VDTADVLAIDDAVARSSGSAGFGITTAGFNPKPFGRCSPKSWRSRARCSATTST